MIKDTITREFEFGNHDIELNTYTGELRKKFYSQSVLYILGREFTITTFEIISDDLTTFVRIVFKQKK